MVDSLGCLPLRWPSPYWLGGVVPAAAETERDALVVSSSAMSRASHTERTSRLSLVTTKVSPSRTAAMTLDVYAELFDDDLDAVAKAMTNARAEAIA